MTRFLVAIALLATAAAAQPSPSSDAGPVISVSGDADLFVPADEAVLHLGVEVLHEDLAVAKARNDERVEAVIAVVQEAGVPDRSITTDWVSVAPEYEYSSGELRYYRVRRSLEVRLTDLERFEDLLTASLAAGATHVHSVSFQTSQLLEYRNRVRATALAAAREKAVAMAGELGRSVGEPVSISEGYANWNSSYGWWGSRNGVPSQRTGSIEGTTSGPMTPGQIKVSARVSVRFALID